MTEKHQEEMVVTEEEQPPKPKKKRRVLVDVSIVTQQGEGALVQWMKPDGKNVARGFVAVADIEGGKVDADVLKAAHPYGVPWGKLVGKILDEIDITPQRIEDALYAHGIWTVHDIEQNTVQAMHAISAITGKIVPILHGEGGKYEKQEQGE